MLPFLFLVVGSLTIFLLGILVYRRNWKSVSYRIFFFLCTVFAVWAVANYISFRVETEVAALWWVRLVMFLAVLQGVPFFLLVHTFPRSTFALSKRTVIGLLLAMCVAMAVTLTPLVFSRVELVTGEPPHPTAGPGILIFILVTIGPIFAGLWVLVRKFGKAQGLEKNQLQYLLLGALSMYALIIIFNFLFVQLFRSTIFVPFAPFFMLPFVASTAYAITRYRMMDIRFVVVRSVLFSLLVGTFFLLYGLVIWIATTLAELRGVVLTPGVHALAAVVVTAIAVFAFSWYRTLLERVTNQVFFKARYNARQALIDLGRQLTETIEIDRIQELLTKTLRETVKVEKIVVFLRDAERKTFRPTWGTEFLSPRTVLKESHALVRHVKHWEGPIVRDELPLILERNDPRHDAEEIKELQTALSWLDASLVVPLLVKGELAGMLLLGDKLAGDLFSSEDVELLTILAPQAATALENARLYQEAAEFGRTLQREVARATEELHIANEQLKDTDKAKSEFLSIAAHQVYTPLTAIRGYLSMIAEGDFGKIPEKLGPTLGVVQQSSERLIELIRSLLDVSRIESGRLELSLESVDLVTMAKGLVEELTPNAGKRGLALTFREPPRKLSPVVADAQRVRQVLLNTLDNAVKYTEKGSIEVRVEEQGDDVVYSVQDTGRGMSKEGIGRLFAKFTRLDLKNGRRVEGMGLGLYVARQIVQEVHGDIWAESAGEGKGSTFFVRLPAEGSPQALKAGTKLIVGIKAAETGERSADAVAKGGTPTKPAEKPDKAVAPEQAGSTKSGKSSSVSPPEAGKKPVTPSPTKRKKPPIS
ncbi:MAG: ATP-binding protein [bacterium]|nr:ATP-binding protein [bacterium]